MVAAGVAGRSHPELARRVDAEEIPLDDAVLDYVARRGRHAFVVEAGARVAAREMRLLAQVDDRREDLLPRLSRRNELLR